jgi:rhodanese-related sulfurtransferase
MKDNDTLEFPGLRLEVLETPGHTIEWVAKHIDGSVNVPLNHLQERIAEIPRDRRIAVHCAGGYRSSIAASILHQYGITNIIEMAGGLAAWDAAKLPVVLEA